jgi:integrase
VSEVVALKVSDIDSARMMIRIEQSKRRKDRYAMQRITAREQPAPRAAHQPPIAQQIEQPRRQHAFLVCTSSRAHISTARAMPIKNRLLNSRAAQTAKLAGNVYELDASHSPC